MKKESIEIGRTYYVLGFTPVRVISIQKGEVKAEVLYLEDACRKQHRYKGSTHTVYIRSLWPHKKCRICGRGFCNCMEDEKNGH